MSQQYLVFDIETHAVDYNSLADSQKEYLIRGATTEEEKDEKKFQMALSPLTSEVVCIGLQLMEGDSDSWEVLQKAAFSTRPDSSSDELEQISLSNGDKCFVGSESRILSDFWKILSKYDRASLISFNGRGFDAPYLMTRSAILRIKPSRNLMAGTKFNYPMHFDLADELTFFSPSRIGATRRYNFDFFARSFGVTSPKADGVDGSKVGELYKNNQIEEIAEYCLRDVTSTWDLFTIWNNYLRF
ncbi:ribonuclease H-like domain-containing protein [Candidatus Kapabacteria bacterium]|nr:ribonuclease H-like domain-containing protein [Candidatus Kapabacteria bacterium]